MDTSLDTLRVFFGRAPFIAELGVEPRDGGAGYVHTHMTLATRHHQHTGQAHAGVVIAMADHTMGASAQTLAADGTLALTAEVKASLLRPARGERLVCEAWVVKQGRHLSFTEARVYAESGTERQLVATASATMALVGIGEHAAEPRAEHAVETSTEATPAPAADPDNVVSLPPPPPPEPDVPAPAVAAGPAPVMLGTVLPFPYYTAAPPAENP